MARDAFDPSVVGAAYDAACDDYVAAFGDDLTRLPVDTAVLVDAVARLRSSGPVLDVGCGPGQVGAVLAERGAAVLGIDLAQAMLDLADKRHQSRPFVCGDMRCLPIRERSCAAVVAYYSVQHVRRDELPLVLREFARVLAVDGVLVVATHLGEGEVFVDEFLGHRIERVGGTMYGREELEARVRAAGFAIEDVRERGPLAHEHPSQRIYLTAQAATSRPGRRPAL